MLALRRATLPAFRALHTTSVAARKGKPVAMDDADMDMDDDLFSGVDAESSSAGSGVRAERRAELVERIMTRNVERVGELRKVVQLSDSAEDLEGLGKVLRAWRAANRKVTTQTAKELVGRCMNLERPDLAHLYLGDRLQYGLPEIPNEVTKKLQRVTAEANKANKANKA